MSGRARPAAPRRPFTEREDRLLVYLRDGGLGWRAIAATFRFSFGEGGGRAAATLQQRHAILAWRAARAARAPAASRPGAPVQPEVRAEVRA
ncbi:hypothetical protein [Zavarzinia sp. CC-PAN008]|uniref:hypothetical protein n=1 Tax=Zavarzinia sp. CC-PAN008 TaxID=3243332 RepID=UPI003F745A3F